MRSHILLLAVIAFCGLAAITPESTRAGLITNGGFEAATAGLPDDWNSTGNLRVVGNQGVTEGSLAVAFSHGNLPSTGALWQTFATQAGVEYLLTFDFGKYSVNQPNQAATLYVDLINGAGLGGTSFMFDVVTDSTPGPGNSSPSADVYNSYSYWFIAVSSSTTLRFADYSDPQTAGGGFDAMLDNVDVNPFNTVPEPTSMALFGLGASTIAYGTRRRRKP
ncbi:PEP-CTERM sorting domain-containing protein [Thalassoglobus sp. JC818]|uniref:PEP-CTERM sorting domain-containing protein n=1 Tax=Thalassoglobus sp. JC818 TaxID=3232136 RepID=UPI00345AE5D6